MSIKTSVRHILTCILFVSWFVGGLDNVQGADLACDHIHLISQGYLSQHVTHSKLNRNLEIRTADQFIKKLDSSKIYLLAPDISKIKKMMKGVLARIKKRDCKTLLEIHKLFANRVKQRADFSKKVMGKNFKFKKETTLLLNSKKRKYFSSQRDAQRFQRKYIQFQISNYLNTDLPLKEAKEHVVRNYERSVRRVRDMKKTDIFALYLDAFARSLDPHSSFFSYDVLEDFQIQMSLSLEGIGATLSNQDGFTIVEQLVPGGAADRASVLEPKDKIIAVAQGDMGKFDNVIEMELRDVVRKIRGKKGTKVRLRILRKVAGKQEKFDITLIRDKIKLEDEAAYITYVDHEVNGKKRKIGILNLPSFYADSKSGGRSSASDVKRLLKEAKKNKVEGLVLDLSKNGGGSLDDAVKIAGLFFKTGAVVKQSSRDPSQEEKVLRDKDAAVDYEGPLVVLISRISASASEIVSGTLQDYRRAVVIGADHTFGKGSVQSVVPLPQKLGAFKVTVGMFFIPGGNSTQHRGVSADVVLPSAYSIDEVGEKSLDYSLPPKKVKSFVSEDAFVKSGEGTWRPVDKKAMAELRKKSKERVGKNKEFQKIIADLAKAAKKKDELVNVGELLKEKEDQDDKEKKESKKRKTKEEKIAIYLKRPDVLEAVNVVGDLMASQTKSRLMNVVRSGSSVGSNKK